MDFDKWRGLKYQTDEKSRQSRLDRESKETLENRRLAAKETERKENVDFEEKKDLANIKSQSDIAQINRVKALELRKVDLIQSRQEHEQGLENKQADYSNTYELNRQSFKQSLVSDWLNAGYDYRKSEMLANKELEKVEAQEVGRLKIASMEIEHKQWEVDRHIEKEITLQDMEHTHLENVQRNQHSHEVDVLERNHTNKIAELSSTHMHKMEELSSIHTHAQMMEYETRKTSSLIARLDAWLHKEKTRIDLQKSEKETMLRIYEKTVEANLEIYVYDEKAKIDERRGFPKQEEIEENYKKKKKGWDKEL